MKKTYFAVSLIFVLIFGWFLAQSSNQAKVDMPTAKATKALFAKAVVATGIVKPRVGAEVKVGSRVSGVVKKLYANVGDYVEKGKLLAKLDDDEWRVRMERAAADVRITAAEWEYAEKQLEKASQLKIISDTDLEKNKRDVKVSKARYEQAKADFESIRIQWAYTEIIAPIFGTIASVSTNEGETVAASLSAPTFVTIIDLNRLEIQAYVDETDIGKILVGEKVTFTLDTYPGAEFEGLIKAIYPKAEIVNNVVNYIVIIDIDNDPQYLIRPEMTTHVRFILEKKEDIVAIPRKALLKKEGRHFVIVKMGTAWEKRQVKLGTNNAGNVEITEGLSEGDIYVLDKQAWVDSVGED